MAVPRHVIISGAGSGLGHGLATRMLARGSRVSVLDLDATPERRAGLDAAAEHGATRWQFARADVTDAAGLAAAVNTAVAASGPPDLALHCAGVGLSRAFADMDGGDFRRVIEINLFGTFHFAAAMRPHLHPGARLALTASVAGLVGNYGYAAYGASKFGVVGLAHVLRAELEPAGIDVSLICPPEVKTPLVTAERQGGDPVGLELKQLAGSLDADDACRRILAGLDAGHWMIIPGIRAKATVWLATRMPGLFHRVSTRVLHRVMRKHGRDVLV